MQRQIRSQLPVNKLKEAEFSPKPKSNIKIISLSPNKHSKRKSKIQSFDSQANSENGKILPSHLNSRDCSDSFAKEIDQTQTLPVRVERPFRPIPRFQQSQLMIRSPNVSGLRESRGDRKQKLMITKNIQTFESGKKNQQLSGKGEFQMSSRR